MSQNTSKNSGEDRKVLLRQDLREGIEGLKELFVATIVVIQDVAQAIPKSKGSKSLTSYSTPAKGQPDSALSLVRDGSQENYSQPLDISIEEVNGQKINQSLETISKSYLYPFLAAISTAALITGVIRIIPLTQWARSQNECIENTSSIDGVNPAGLSSKVMHCNGGHSY